MLDSEICACEDIIGITKFQETTENITWQLYCHIIKAIIKITANTWEALALCQGLQVFTLYFPAFCMCKEETEGDKNLLHPRVPF